MTLFLQDKLLLKTKCLVDGNFIDANSGDSFPVYNPSNGEIVAQVTRCAGVETQLAIVAAERAFKNWSKVSVAKRSKLLMAWYDLIIANKNDLAHLLSAEQGKPLAEAVGEVLYGASYIQWFAEEAKRVQGDIISSDSRSSRLLCIKQPVGVVACITPWNFPNAMLTRKIAPALAAGCTVVCKPATETPLSALALGELACRAGIPAGVINIVCGKTGEIGANLTASPIVRKLTFTGSTEVGKKLMADCAETMKRVSMELGGNAPFLVFESADLDEAIKGLMSNKFRNSGQTCIATNRVFVQSSVMDKFSSKLVEAIRNLKVGDGFDPEVSIGPLINEKAVIRVKSLLEDANNLGANIISFSDQGKDNGNFLAPSIVMNATPNMRVFSEEIFGPIAPLFAFDTEEDGLALANETPSGLAAYFYSNDMSQIWRVSESLEVGMVGVNDTALSNAAIPFGGVKESGLGREGSRYGLDEYLEIKHIKMGGLKV